jgi:hypothetical protein
VSAPTAGGAAPDADDPEAQTLPTTQGEARIALPATDEPASGERPPLLSGLGRGAGLLGDLALLLFVVVPAGVLLLSVLPGRAGAAGVGRSVPEERVAIVGVALAMWVGVALAVLLGGP